jgi:hypothetical protein
MINFMNQPNQHMSFANGCLSLAEWLTAVFAKLQHRGVLDFDRAMWQFVYILLQVHCAAIPVRLLRRTHIDIITTACVSIPHRPPPQPRLVYKDSVFHKQTNATWAREDPAFIITLTAFMLVSAVAYGVAFSEPIVEFGFLLLEVVVIHLYLASAACATIAWALASSHLKSGALSTHATSGAKVGSNSRFSRCIILYWCACRDSSARLFAIS